MLGLRCLSRHRVCAAQRTRLRDAVSQQQGCRTWTLRLRATQSSTPRLLQGFGPRHSVQSQRPVNPARRSPVTTTGQRRMMFHSRPER